MLKPRGDYGPRQDHEAGGNGNPVAGGQVHRALLEGGREVGHGVGGWWLDVRRAGLADNRQYYDDDIIYCRGSVISRETAADVPADVREEAETGGDYQEFAEKLVPAEFLPHTLLRKYDSCANWHMVNILNREHCSHFLPINYEKI